MNDGKENNKTCVCFVANFGDGKYKEGDCDVKQHQQEKSAEGKVQ